MYCENCGRKYPKGTVYCEYCGAKLKEDVFEDEGVNPQNNAAQENSDTGVQANPTYQCYPKQPKCWTIFAKLGFAFGLVSLIGSFIPFIGIAFVDLSIPGIVFSALGKKVYDPNVHSKASTGLVLSIIATITTILMFIIYTVALGIGIAAFSSLYW